MPCSSHPPWLDHCNCTWSFLQPPVTSSLFGPNILLNTLFSNTLSLCSFLKVREQVSHPYRTTGTIIVLYILIFMFLDSRREDKKAPELNGRIMETTFNKSGICVLLGKSINCKKNEEFCIQKGSICSSWVAIRLRLSSSPNSSLWTLTFHDWPPCKPLCLCKLHAWRKVMPNTTKTIFWSSGLAQPTRHTVPPKTHV
jgi:hypothetical protein